MWTFNELAAAWHSEHRARLVAGATALVLAGWSFGFFSGRMSAWIFPIDPRAARIAAENAPGVAAMGAPAKKELAAVHPVQPKSMPDEAAAAAAHQQEPAASAAPRAEDEEPKVASRALSGPASAGPGSAINDAAPLAPDPIARPGEDDEPVTIAEPQQGHGNSAGLDECERRYTSFRRSDGTYQPYGSRSREICPHLRLRK